MFCTNGEAYLQLYRSNIALSHCNHPNSRIRPEIWRASNDKLNRARHTLYQIQSSHKSHANSTA